jgi:hypothetical protein
MAANAEYEFKKLNDLLCTSFNNIKYDVRDINTKIENLKTDFTSFSTDSIKTAFEDQTKLILEQQKAINQLNERISELESRPEKTIIRQERAVQQTQQPTSPQVSTVFKNKESALSEVRKILKEEEREKAHSSIYNIPEGEVRITKTQFKPIKKGKKKLNDEWVEVTGYGVDMSGYTLHDKGRKHIFKFPEGFRIYGPVKIFTGRGKNTNTRLYWKCKTPVWNDSGDVATLKAKNGRAVSQVLSEPVYSFKTLK